MPVAINIVAGILVLAATVFSVWLLVRTVRSLLTLIVTAPKGLPRSDRPGTRVRTLLREFLGHTRMAKIPLVSVAHWVVMISFIVLFATLVTAYGQIISPSFHIPLLGIFPPFEWITEIFAWLGLVGIVTLILIRLTRLPSKKGRASRFFGSRMWQGYYVEYTILLVTLCILVLRGLEYALAAATEGAAPAWWHFPLTGWIGGLFVGLSVSGLEVLIVVVATVKILISLTWVVMIAKVPTMGVAWHRFLAFFNIYLKRNADGSVSLGPLLPMQVDGKPIDFENIEDLPEDAVFGVGALEDLTSKTRLDTLTCTECGRCQSQCPAWATEKPLNPKLLMTDLREGLAAIGGLYGELAQEEAAARPFVGSREEANALIDTDVLWSCTTCGACVNECPVDIEHVDTILDLRRNQVLVESEFPSEFNAMFKNVETKGNPWGMNASTRNAWIQEVDFPVKVFGEDGAESILETEYLFWVGCAGAFEDRAKRTTKAVAELLYMAGLDFVVLGDGETCNGDPARRAGNEFIYQMQAMQNIEMLNEIKAKKIVVTCPHCLNTIGNEYPELGGLYEVVHHTQLLNRLVGEGRITPVQEHEGTITFHDPCYLGRHNKIYSPPRELIESIPGAEVTEMEKHGERSFCCGAGGARMWTEETIGTRINLTRTDHALDIGAETIAVGCPFCHVMLGDGVAARAGEDGARQDQAKRTVVIDVAELLLNSARIREERATKA